MTSPTEIEDRENRRLRFDGTITAGNILTAAGIIVALVVWGIRLEGRVDQEALLRAQLEKRIEVSEGVSAASALEIKAQLRDLGLKLDRLIERVSPIRER